MNFEEVLEHLGHFGSYQIVVYSLVCIPSLLVGIHIMASVFLMGIPKHRCFIKNCDNSLSEFEEPWFQYSVPKNDARGFNQCYRFKKATSTGNVSCLVTDFSNATEKCSNWVWNKEEFQWTTVSEWNLVCEQSMFVALSGSVFMIGILVGALAFGALADKVGRKRVFLFAPPLLVLSSVGTAFSPNYVVFILLRFVTAAAISGLFQTGYVIVVEAVGVSRRLWCANMLQVVFAFGELVLALVAYFIQNWRTLELVIAGPTALLLVYYWILPESIRWYISKEKFDKARTTIEKAALWNKVEVPDSVYTSTEENIALCDQDSKKPTAGIVDLLRNPCLCRRTLNIAFNWFVNSLVYYGLSMNAGNLGGDVYVNFVALAAVEIPAVVLGTLILSCVGRRTLLSAMLLLGGLCCVVNPFIPTTLAWAGTTLAVIGKSQIAVSFAVVYVYSAEIFPTVVRNAGIGFSSMCSRIGGILAPLVANLRIYTHGEERHQKECLHSTREDTDCAANPNGKQGPRL
ncbi:organic cation transporter protein-like isoform X2 [Tachypleus tridentatus]|uniref:organic cation transporter protein-like isoform X2 n=1 Tax=Tachypleus tridentatus TaxID=6853 RepID=UPI003FD35540